ncbi:putative siderophore transport system permease protein YfiZ precursor [Vibrio aerogenes CECT 7868]|uniref:Putative siderophore transport system permease protein YfiZ n=1 Tax=Vibrio aerogenes CECT 7868 TaxID=1216006 RepID=A0A1M5XC95_9VIBR|nr:iron ABC transporter permease [Vibrio aerogenes]SHH97272.1 putative siderophore transport system permease protein YfiZ precursor [Vibrio aerogenes CECT 7868]
MSTSSSRTNIANPSQEPPWGKQLWLLSMLVILLAGFSVFIGSRPIPVQVTIDALLHFNPADSQHLLVHYLRVPRTLLAIVVGVAAGGAGVLMQALTRNPLADPGILGVNAGAMAAIVMAIAGLDMVDVSHYMWFGMAGAAVSGIAVYFLAGGSRMNPVRIVLAGSAVTVVLLALTHIITINSHQEVFEQFRHWTVGALQGRGYPVLIPVSVLVAAGALLALSLASVLNTVVLGQDLGKALGASPVRVWLLASLAIILLAGASTAAVGPISFLGLTAPHLARFFVGSDHHRLLPFSMLIAAVLLLIADIAGRLIGYPGEISVGIMVALIGGPFFVFLVRKWKLSQL